MFTKFIKGMVFLSLLTSYFSLFTYSAEANSDTAADFLKSGIGARASGMGEAAVALECGGLPPLSNHWTSLDSIYFNPAGLAGITKKEVSAMYGDKREDTSKTFLAYAQPIEKEDGEGVFGIGIIQQDLGKIELRDKLNAPVGEVSPSEFALILSYAKLYDENLSVGGNLKYIHRDLEKLKAKGFVLDLGVLFEIRNSKFLKIGCLLRKSG